MFFSLVHRLEFRDWEQAIVGSLAMKLYVTVSQQLKGNYQIAQKKNGSQNMCIGKYIQVLEVKRAS